MLNHILSLIDKFWI